MAQETSGPFATWRRARVRLPAAALLIYACLPAVALAQAGATWPTQGGDQQGTRFSSLTDITTGNVGTLTEEFSYATNAIESHEGGPLVVNNIMYAVTPFPNNLIALDLTHPGRTLWTYEPNTKPFSRGKACCDQVNRGAAYADGLVVYTLLDGHVVAVNAATGQQVWRTEVADLKGGETLTAAPIIIKHNVIIGDSGGEFGVRGWVQALDLKTGKPVWKAYNTGPDADVMIGKGFHAFYPKDQGKDLGATSWPGTLWQQGGATAWGYKTYDPELNLLYYGTSNPGPWNPSMRPGDNKWSATIFARNPDTGEAVWATQLTPHDGWDFDSIGENIVADMTIAGTPRKVIVHFDKNGYGYTIDRATGELIVANPVTSVTWSKGVNLKTGEPRVVPDMQPRQGKTTTGVCPSPLGMKDYEPAAYSPATNLFYVPAHSLCDNVEPLLALYIAGTPFMGVDLSITGGSGSPGELVAWDATTGKAAWTVNEPFALYGGVLTTAGNVVFYGTLDNHFDAVDASTGKLLWQTTLECGIVSTPMSYTGPDGKQRVAVMTGIGGFAGGLVGAPCPNADVWGDAKVNPNGTVHAANVKTPLALAMEKLAATQPARAPTGVVTSGFIHVFKLP